MGVVLLVGLAVVIAAGGRLLTGGRRRIPLPKIRQWPATARHLGREWIVVLMIVCSPLLTINSAQSMLHNQFGISLSDTWYSRGTLLSLGFVILWRLMKLQRRIDAVDDQRAVLRELDEFHTEFLDHVKACENYRERLEFIEGQTNYGRREERLNALHDLIGDAEDSIIRLRRQVACYIDATALLGPVRRAQFLAAPIVHEDSRWPVVRTGCSSARALLEIMGEVVARDATYSR